MPELKCTVQTCLHNQQFLCNLDSIRVGGSDARSPRETCCDSFQERAGNSSYTNISDSTASVVTGIDCKARDCMYNEDCLCHAGKISVEGSHATHPEGTECATFEYTSGTH